MAAMLAPGLNGKKLFKKRIKVLTNNIECGGLFLAGKKSLLDQTFFLCEVRQSLEELSTVPDREVLAKKYLNIVAQ